MGGALGDIAAAMAGAGFESVESVDIAYAFQSAQFSRGTLSSILSVLQEKSLLGFEDGEWKSVRIGGHTAAFDYPQPIGRRVGFNIPGAEILLTPRHLKIGKWLRIYVAFHPIVAYTLGFLAPVAVWLARSPFGKWAMNFMRKTQFGPSEKERAAFRFYFQARVVIEQDGKSTVRRVLIQGQDAYGTTAKLAVNTALAMLQPDYKRSGALTMPQAFDLNTLEKILQETGVSFHTVS